jgi:leucyl aminopeptidase (aminopeptidase T)|tara:strand:- start:233 stop:679 length:447 start_codon:yes stop_codon:yes gene_type:complete
MAIPWMGMAALSGGLGLVGNIFGARSAASAAQAQVDASADQLTKNVMLNREARKGNLAKFIGQNVADYGYGAEEDFRRQKLASIFDSTRKRDLERGANIADFEAMLGMKENPLAREQKQRERKFQLDKITRERQAQMEGMFGPISRTT